MLASQMRAVRRPGGFTATDALLAVVRLCGCSTMCQWCPRWLTLNSDCPGGVYGPPFCDRRRGVDDETRTRRRFDVDRVCANAIGIAAHTRCACEQCLASRARRVQPDLFCFASLGITAAEDPPAAKLHWTRPRPHHKQDHRQPSSTGRSVAHPSQRESIA